MVSYNPVGTTAPEALMHWEMGGFPESRWGGDRAKGNLRPLPRLQPGYTGIG